jgi:hypothetical protein
MTATPTTPTESLTTATTLPSNMSRSNSLYNEPVLESFQMMKFNSNTSFSSNVNSSDQVMYEVNPLFTSSHHSRRSSSEEQSQLLVGAGGASHDSQFSHSFPSANTFASDFQGERMEKSQSSESTLSTASSRNKQSLQARSKERLQATLAAARPLMPKGGSDETAMSRTDSSKSMSRLESKDGSQDKVAISKPTYTRPKHDRVFCKQCDCKPDGFRGEHELRRHQDREHKKMVKKWVCVEPTGHSHPKPEMPLSKCKACGIQKKKYGAYYNAAAHLRRTHFKPKMAKGQRKNSKVDDGEKRGGKGGGDWPPMAELKYWMKEVEEQVPDYPITSQQDEADGVSDDETLEGGDNDNIYASQFMTGDCDETVETNYEENLCTPQPMSGVYNYNTKLLDDVSPLPDIYPAVTYDIRSTFDLKPEQSTCIDSSMFGQNNFQNFSSGYSNDALAYFDPAVLPQTFDDQILTGPEFTNFTYQ